MTSIAAQIAFARASADSDYSSLAAEARRAVVSKVFVRVAPVAAQWAAVPVAAVQVPAVATARV